jgi:hypothetical protein
MGVYYLPRLTMNIMSVSQLDELGCRIDIEHDILRIYKQGRKLLVHVKRSTSRLHPRPQDWPACVPLGQERRGVLALAHPFWESEIQVTSPT